MAGNNTFLNLAHGATESTFYAHCLHDTLPKEVNVDLIILEFAINDMRWDTRITPYMDNTKRWVLNLVPAIIGNASLGVRRSACMQHADTSYSAYAIPLLARSLLLSPLSVRNVARPACLSVINLTCCRWV